jgi:hypothetical protein
MDLKEILVCITNHNENENALYLKKIFSNYIETIIIDSKSNQVADEFDIKLENVYYTGLFNESFNQCSIKNKKYCFFIASDVYIDNLENIVSIIESLEDDIYIWAPSSKGQSHNHCKNFGSGGLREVPYVEGFLFLSNLDVMRNMIPIDLNKNKYGFGIDLLMGLNCVKRLKKKCVIDDRTEVYHKEGTGYDQSKALNDMYNWLLNDFDNISREYAVLYSKSPGYEKLLEYLKL